jgi:ubiquinone biosynthesis protein
MWSTADPVVRTWIEQNLGPAGKLQDVGRGLAAIGRLATQAPDWLERVERIAAGLETGTRRPPWHDLESEGERRAARRTAWQRNAALWAIVGLLAILAFVR